MKIINFLLIALLASAMYVSFQYLNRDKLAFVELKWQVQDARTRLLTLEGDVAAFREKHKHCVTFKSMVMEK